MTPWSGSPSQARLSHSGKDSSSAETATPQAAANLASTVCQGGTGSASSSSMVPERNSSDQARIDSAGTSSRQTHGSSRK